MVSFNFTFLLLCFALFAFRRMLRYLHIFQQEDYDGRRFLIWIYQTGSFDHRMSEALLIFWAVSQEIPQLGASGNFLAVLFAFFSIFEQDPRSVAKKKLVMTKRAVRICIISFLLMLSIAYVVIQSYSILFWIGAVQLIPLTLVVANIILMPLEASIQKRIMKEASFRLAQIHPQVIGITGSFGKTSVKHILGHILEMNEPTLFTPGSVNTLMGISRIIREKLQPNTRFFLVEMGAYAIGSIAKLCRLTPPHIGIITAIGEAHYERFKTLDGVARAKFQLAEAVLSQEGGQIIVHESVLSQNYARTFITKERKRFIICGTGTDVDLKIGSVEQTIIGLNVSLYWQGREYKLYAPLFGFHHASNMALAFATAIILGISPDRAVAALRTVPQIKHRLEVKKLEDGTIYIDDGFNSNQGGFLSALDLLSSLGAEQNRRILITPGIVELGNKHDEVHRILGAEAAKKADITYVVRADKIPTFIEAFHNQDKLKSLHLVSSLKEALDQLKQDTKPGDVILIENDLPDLGEARMKL